MQLNVFGEAAVSCFPIVHVIILLCGRALVGPICDLSPASAEKDTFENQSLSQAWWCMRLIPALREAEAGGSL